MSLVECVGAMMYTLVGGHDGVLANQSIEVVLPAGVYKLCYGSNPTDDSHFRAVHGVHLPVRAGAATDEEVQSRIAGLSSAVADHTAVLACGSNGAGRRLEADPAAADAFGEVAHSPRELVSAYVAQHPELASRTLAELDDEHAAGLGQLFGLPAPA